MTSFREKLKRATPFAARELINGLRRQLAPPPIEAIKFHPYSPVADPSRAPRLTLVLPSLNSALVFGGVATGIEIFLHCAARLGAEPRIAIDDFDRQVDQALLAREAKRAGLDVHAIEVIHRDAEKQAISVRVNDVFFAFNWWTAINLGHLLDDQASLFDAGRRPLVQIVQEYEPLFYPMSSTHMHARSAFGDTRNWAIINSSQLHRFMTMQGHAFDREYVIEPRMSASLRALLPDAPLPKRKTILVYGRPAVARNCFSSIVEGLRAFLQMHPEFEDWEIVSAGAQHGPVRLSNRNVMRSLGKLSLEQYAARLREAGVGLSLMASPHPSYPPLEMAHFGILTITNSYVCKDLSLAHDNITSLNNIGPATIAEALARACRRVADDPLTARHGRTHIPGYLETRPFDFYDRLIPDLDSLMAR